MQPSRKVLASPLRVIGVALLATLPALTGCQNLRPASPRARQAAQAAAELQRLQTQNMRFADDYVGQLIEGVHQAQIMDATPTQRFTLSGWLLAQANTAYTIASSDNAVVNLLDLVALASLSRIVVEESTLQRFPEQAAGLLRVHRRLEVQAWNLADTVLTPEQKADLNRVLLAWRAEHQDVTLAPFVRFQEFLDTAPATPSDPTRSAPRSLIGIVGLDPLAGLDPAVRQVEQSRLLAERAIYYAQRVPIIMDLQLDRALNRVAADPETQQLLTQTATMSSSAERFAAVAEALPADFAREREALVRQLSELLTTQQATLLPMLVELRGALEAGQITAGSVDQATRSIDALMARFQDRVRPPDQPPGRPFDITEYTQAASEITRAANELTQLMKTIGMQAPGVGGAVGSTLETSIAQGRSLIDHLYLRLAWLISLLLGGLLAVLLIYRWLAPRIQRT
jgi:hypothetical protein